MANINKIVKFDLDERAVHLRGEKQLSFNDIATTLSEESGEKISKASVQRFFEARDRDRQKAVAMSSKLQAKVAEAEINTIDEVRTNIEELREISRLAKEAGDYRTAANALEKIYAGLDIINKVLGKYQTSPQVQFNFQEVNIDATRDKITRRINSIAARARTSEDSQ